MNGSDQNLPNTNNSIPVRATFVTPVQFWSAVVFAILQFLVLEGIGIFRFIKASESASKISVLSVVVVNVFIPLMFGLMTVIAYLKIKRLVLDLGCDSNLLRAIIFHGLSLLGSAFLAITLAILNGW